MRASRLTRFLSAWTLLGLLAAGAPHSRTLHDVRGEALRLYDAGRYQEALPLIDEVLSQKRRDIDLLNKRGCIYIRMNQPARALPDLNEATRYSPFLAYDQMQMDRQFLPDIHGYWFPGPYAAAQMYPSAFTNRGIALMMLGRDDEALADFRSSISIRLSYYQNSPGSGRTKWQIGMASAYCGLGQVFHRKGDDASALDAFDRAIRYNPDDPNGYIGRGVAQAALGRFDHALASYESALRINPNDSRAYGYHAATLRQLGRDGDALSNLDASIRIDPGVAMTHRLRGAWLSSVGRHEQAISDLDEAIRIDPGNASAFKDRGGIYNRLGDPARGLRDLDEAIRLDPNDPKAYQNRAASHNGLGRYAEAVADCDAAIRLDPASAGAFNNRGLARLGQGHLGRAVADLTEAIRFQPRQAVSYIARGGAYLQMGLLEQAAADYEQALRLDPNSPLAESRLGQIRDNLKRRAGSAHGPAMTPRSAPTAVAAP